MGKLRMGRVFIAEDDDELRTVLVAAFQRDGFQVVEAMDGPNLVDHLVQARHTGAPVNGQDVVVSDLRMPGFSGLQVLASFKNLHWNTPFILISAFVDEETQEYAHRLGAAAVFSKPFDVDELRAAVLGIADSARAPASRLPE